MNRAFIRGDMFHKPKLMKMYVERQTAYMLRAVFIMIGIYFAIDLYQVISAQVLYQNGEAKTSTTSPVLYWTAVVYKAALMCVNFYFVTVFRVKTDSDKDNPRS